MDQTEVSVINAAYPVMVSSEGYLKKKKAQVLLKPAGPTWNHYLIMSVRAGISKHLAVS